MTDKRQFKLQLYCRQSNVDGTDNFFLRSNTALSMASLALGIVPSDEEVNAIKQQLKLLGHSLPTEVIVKFLQENNELLTACQNPKYGLTIGEDPTARSQPASRWPDVQSNTERAVQSHQDTAVLESFSEAVQKSGSAAPQLDVTWASAGPDGVLTSRVLHVISFFGTNPGCLPAGLLFGSCAVLFHSMSHVATEQ